jgi:hypothetical protein
VRWKDGNGEREKGMKYKRWKLYMKDRNNGRKYRQRKKGGQEFDYRQQQVGPTVCSLRYHIHKSTAVRPIDCESDTGDYDLSKKLIACFHLLLDCNNLKPAVLSG